MTCFLANVSQEFIYDGRILTYHNPQIYDVNLKMIIFVVQKITQTSCCLYRCDSDLSAAYHGMIIFILNMAMLIIIVLPSESQGYVF